MKWVTRSGAKVDRVACPWLIQRFIDSKAQFLFVPADRVAETAQREGATPFDVKDTKFGHRHGLCTFEVLLEEHNLEDPALRLMGRIVHGADVPEDISIEPEAAGLRAIAHGFAETTPDDQRKLELEFPLYDALYAYCQTRVAAQKL